MMHWKSAAVGLFCLAAAQQQDKAQLQQTLKDTEVKGAWVYDDINAGYAQAKKANKPLLIVFR